MAKLLTCLLFFLVHTLAQQMNEQGFQEVGDPLQNQLLENEELSMERQYEEEEEKNLHPWITQEFKEFDESQEIITRETFSFQIDQKVDFKWNPSKEGNFRIMIEIFQDIDGDVYLPQNPDQDTFISVQVNPSGSRSFSQVGSVYIKKVFKITFHRDYQILRFRNNYGRKMLIQVGLEDLGYIPETGLKDDILKLSNEKMNAIMAQVKQTQIRRQKLSKSEWGFRDRQERHQSQMLVLTGVQLLFIISTAIIQMFCIKNLLENRSIV